MILAGRLLWLKPSSKDGRIKYESFREDFDSKFFKEFVEPSVYMCYVSSNAKKENYICY